MAQMVLFYVSEAIKNKPTIASFYMNPNFAVLEPWNPIMLLCK